MPLDSLLSTQGIMVALLAAYAVAMWVFLRSAPKVHTIMVSDLEAARDFYEGILKLRAADVPLHYYYDYQQTIGGGLDPMAMTIVNPQGTKVSHPADGLWYQLKKNTQLHAVIGASPGEKDRQRHVCFDRECLEMLLMRVQTQGIKHKILRERPLTFLAKDWEGEVFEFAELKS
jgi:catechol 2,3-dioxygenase-like lactoylglutathione lyase family enzyme